MRCKILQEVQMSVTMYMKKVLGDLRCGLLAWKELEGGRGLRLSSCAEVVEHHRGKQ